MKIENGMHERDAIDIIPNPVINTFVIKNNTNKEVRSIEVYDMAGRHICMARSANFDMSKYSSGRYLVRVQYTDDSETSKLFIKEE